MAGPIIVEGPDGQEYEFPEGTSPDVMKQAMRKRYAVQGTPALAPPPAQQPQTRNTIRTGPREFPTSSDRMSGREDTRIIVQAQRALAAQQEAERLARVKPVEQAAGQAGRAAMNEQWGDPMPFRESEFMLSPQEQRGMQAERQVYRDADVTSSLDAATIRGLNSMAMGIPGILNKDFRGELAAAGNDQPGASLAADVVGFLAPGIGAWNTTRAAVNAFARPFIPRGADAASRTVRYAAPVTGQVAGASAQNAAFQAGVQEPIRAEMAGEDLTLAGMGEAAQRGATDPLNFLPVGLSAVNRTWNQLTSGIATPSARAAEMANLYGVGPRQTAASQGIAQTTQQLGGQLQGADIRGLTNIENALRFALRDNRNIPDVNARIATGFERIRQSLPLEDDPTLNLARLIEREFAPDAPQTRDIIRNFLRGVGLNSPGGGQIVGDAANQMRGQQADVLRTELESSFGAQPKTEANAAMQQSLDQFSAAYNTVLGAAPRQGPQVERALELLAREPQSAAILDDIAQSQNLTAEQFIERNPLQALHVVQSELATQARAMAARGDAGAGPLEITVRNMQRPLRDAVPGYGDLQGLWRQWTQARERMGYVRGAAAGTGGELSTVPGFGDKIFGPGGIAKSEMGTQTAADLYLQMDDLSQRAAGLSVRDVINDELRKAKAAGLEERYQTAANMRKVATEGGLDALRRVFGEAGDRVARRIEQFMDANEFARNIDPEFNSATMNKAQAMATGAQPFASGLGQSAQGASNAMTESAVADAVLMLSGAPPIISAMRAPGIVGRLLQPGQRTQRNIAETLLRRGQIGSQVPPRPGGPAPITPIDPAMVPGAGPAPGGPPPGSLPPTGGAPPQAPRTVGVAPAAAGAPAMAAPAGAPAGAPVLTTPTPPTRTAGFGIGPNAQAALQQSAFGSIGGSAYGSQNDVNGDGVIDEQDAYAGAFLGGTGLPLAAGGLRTVGRPRPPGGAAPGGMAPGGTAPSGRTVGQGGYFGRQSMRPPGSGPSAREIETQQQWSTATPIVSQARTTAQSAQQAADAALQSKAPADIARAKDAKKSLVGQLQEAQASRAGMDTPEDARLAETLASLAENTSDPVLLSTQISAAKTSLDRLLTDIGSPVEGNLIPVKTNILTRTQAPRSAAEGPQDRASVTRYAEGGDEIKPQGFGAGGPEGPERGAYGEQAVEHFGLTNSIDEAGYMLPDGKMLDLSGRHDMLEGDYIRQGTKNVATGRDWQAGQRNTDHRELPFSVVSGDSTANMLAFQKEAGAIRIMPGTGISVVSVPERSQVEKLVRAWKRRYGSEPMLVDVDDLNGRNISSVDVENVTVDSVLKAFGAPSLPTKGMGFGASTPKPPQQAARFETPGSPEYEAAVAKGLDMSQAGRMGRAREMGFDTDTVLYHGTDATFDEFRPNDLGMIWLTSDAAHASNFGKVSPYYVSFPKGKYITTGQMDLNDPDSVMKAFKEGGFSDETAEDAVDVFKRGGINSENLLADLIKNGMPQKNTWRIKGWEGKGEVVVTTDPSNIRSVHAAFDPEKSTSSTLLAAAPFAAVGGAGLTLAGEDARNQRTVGKPKAVQSGTSQSARTVGKAKTN